MLTVEAIEENLSLQIQEDDISLTMQIADSAPSGVVVSGAPGNVLQTIPDGLYVGAVQYVQTIDDLALINPDSLKDGQSAQVVSPGRAGLFRWQSGDLSAEVAADPLRGIYVPADGDDGSGGAWVRERDGDGFRPEWFGAGADVDSGAAISAAAELGDVVIDTAILIDSDTTLKSRHFHGTGRIDVGPSGVLAVVVSDQGSAASWSVSCRNASGDEVRQAVTFRSDNPGASGEKKGAITVLGATFDGFLRACHGDTLKSFVVRGCAFRSVSSDPDRFAEAHTSCNHTDFYLCQGNNSQGGVLAHSSGAGVVEDVYLGNEISGTLDHGIYSSSPTGKVRTVMTGNVVRNTGGSGLKCFSNGLLIQSGNTVESPGAVGIICVADVAMVIGNTVSGGQSSGAIYQQGKELGAGANEFQTLLCKGNLVRDWDGDGIRVFGPDVLGEIILADNYIECTGRPVNVTGASLQCDSVRISGGMLRTSTSIAAVSCLGAANVAEVQLSGVSVLTDTSSTNQIDVDTPSLSVNGCRFSGAAQRAIRNRHAAGQTLVGDVSLSADYSMGQIVLTDNPGSLLAYKTEVSMSGTRIRRGFAASAPTFGQWGRGDTFDFVMPSAGGAKGVVCVSAGSPGGWREFGTIAE